MVRLTPSLLLRAYAAGIFPMAEDADSSTVYWFNPSERGILPLDQFHVPRRLARTVRSGRFTVTVDQDFAAVMAGCAEATHDRPRTWINQDILDVYGELHRLGHAHSVEVRAEAQLVGGLYGVSLGAAFFGESMFSRVRDASKVALVHLVARLVAGGYLLLDTQFVTEHLSQFGALEIPAGQYRRLLDLATSREARFHSSVSESELVSGFLHSRSQMS